MKYLLVGIPSSGKTTLGKSAADLLDFPFYDIDEISEKRDRDRILCLICFTVFNVILSLTLKVFDGLGVKLWGYTYPKFNIFKTLMSKLLLTERI